MEVMENDTCLINVIIRQFENDMDGTTDIDVMKNIVSDLYDLHDILRKYLYFNSTIEKNQDYLTRISCLIAWGEHIIEYYSGCDFIESITYRSQSEALHEFLLENLHLCRVADVYDIERGTYLF